jgi:hypothetical protein
MVGEEEKETGIFKGKNRIFPDGIFCSCNIEDRLSVED